ncbi:MULTISPECIES: efflux RND transporter periplasmic adaptor subunit [unclassified Lentimonas]|uniref:efflux RND transporter periplasmic adaptor subunit n=1 Tax=unclassified Lentimonas TaxID=2630993 RepID=UPI001327DC50|nr:MULTISPECIES: efflux RND transporter periplasmic adaptor subunit [unclassified Lentimonas]CAA6677241.1 Unannotated [Lentimonas sp. CC4]CAA6686134.1 Unannotated [Lentimonas sp. CC6]CAA7074166.1 Unannotated [Lentimonas sp. CC4]CAA7171524.1 Unannotated [Lentimonas sp. CC21]CAA7182002.1 Unannotated [Lentimonas sp. CC8]
MKSKFLIFVLFIVVVGAGVVGMKVLKATGPEAKKRQPKVMQVLVDAMPIEQSDAGVRIEGMGLVVAAREVTLKAQVSGRVLEIAPGLLEGLHVDAGTVLAQIEGDDYELKLEQAASTLELRSAELDLEMGFQRVATREWELLGDSDDVMAESSSLALREPQLKQAKAMERSAQSALDQAKLDLSRTEIVAPFNALVLSKSVEVGSMAGMGGEVAQLVSTDAFHVRVSVPVSKLSVLEIPGAEAIVSIDGADTPLPGRVISLLGDLDPDGRMARVLVEVKDPLGLESENDERPKLLLGSYVAVELVGHELPGSVTIPRNTLHNGDNVWVVGEGSKLEIRPVSVIWKNRDTVVVGSGVNVGERLITSPLSFAADGMAVSVIGDAAPQGKKKGPASAAK